MNANISKIKDVQISTSILPKGYYLRVTGFMSREVEKPMLSSHLTLLSSFSLVECLCCFPKELQMITLKMTIIINTMKMINAMTQRQYNLSGANFFEATKSIPEKKYIVLETKEACHIATIPIKIVEKISSPFILIIQIFCVKVYGSKTH